MLSLNLKPEEKTMVRNNIESVLNEKDTGISALKNELMLVKKAHSNMLEVFLKKMEDYFIPVEELGFPVKLPDMSI